MKFADPTPGPATMRRAPRLRTAAWWLLAFLVPGLAGRSQAAGPEPVTIRSQSGQFVVRGVPQAQPTPLLGFGPESGSNGVPRFLRLDPQLTAVALERIRQAIQAELGWPNEWRGMIAVTTEPVLGENTRVTIVGVHHPSGWTYRIVFPEIIDKDRFIAASVKTILMEFANRRATDREAEIPLWLAEGLTAELMATSLPTLALEQQTEVNQRGRNPDPLADARQRLRTRDPLTFDLLSQPPGELSAEDAAHYRACAHVFVHELLRLRQGPAALRMMLERLPENFNWQTTFLEAFRGQFKRLLDVDQWYSLAVTGARSRDLSSILSRAATLQQLGQILPTPVEVRLVAEELPIRTEMSLPRLVTEWDYPRQHPVLVDKIVRLRSLQGRAAPETVRLVSGYLDALIGYVGPRNLDIPTRPKDIKRLRARGDVQKFIVQLGQLESRRGSLAAPTAAARTP